MQPSEATKWNVESTTATSSLPADFGPADC